MKAMIFAAGLGTRLRPLTNDKPKALVEYQGKPLLQHIIEKLKFYGFDEIVVNVHHFADMIKDFLKKNDFFGVHLSISDESDQLLETGGGLFKAREFLDGNEPFLVHNVDIITELDLGKLFHAFDDRSIAMLAVQNRPANRKLIFSHVNGLLCGWRNLKTGEQIIARKNCPQPREFAFSGVHVVSPRIFDFLWQGKYSITTAYLKIARTEPITFYDHTGDMWKDMGTIDSFK